MAAVAVVPVELDVVAVVSVLAGQLRSGLTGLEGSGLLSVAERARAATAWLASVEFDAVSQLLRVQEREARLESEALARVEKRTPHGVQAAGAAAGPHGWDWTTAEVACAFRLTTRQAEGRVKLASLLRDLPPVHALLRAGLIDEYRARVIAETLDASALTPQHEAWTRLVDLVCSRAPDRTHVQIRAHLNRQLLKIDPDATRRRRATALAGRQVRCWAEPDGMATLHATISGETAAIIDTALNAMADAARSHAQPSTGPGSTGSGSTVAATHQERRADAFGEVFRSILEGRPLRLVPPAAADADPDAGATADAGPDNGLRVPAWWEPPQLPTAKGRRPHLIVTIADTTLTGQDDAPADLAGYGPIPADIGRRIAHQASTYRLLPLPRATPTGQHTTDQTDAADRADRSDGADGCARNRCGTDSYVPDQRLIDDVIATHPTCQAPGCTRPATHCDLDHVTPHQHGGRTCIHNLRPLCRRHHQLKTHAGWQRTHPTEPATAAHPPHPPGTVVWTTRLGRRYTVPPPDRPGTPDW